MFNQRFGIQPCDLCEHRVLPPSTHSALPPPTWLPHFAFSPWGFLSLPSESWANESLRGCHPCKCFPKSRYYYNHPETSRQRLNISTSPSLPGPLLCPTPLQRLTSMHGGSWAEGVREQETPSTPPHPVHSSHRVL